jgi:endonuclease YncB( thermonuclease family)
VYLSDTDLLNADLVRDGLGYADRRLVYSQRQSFEQAEGEARKRKRGVWSVADGEESMPQWRREWLASIKRTDAATRPGN